MNRKKSAFVMGKIENVKKTAALEQLWSIESVEDVHLTAGPYDFVVKVSFDSFESFFDAYLQVKKIPEIKAQKVLIAAPGDVAVQKGSMQQLLAATA